MTFVPLAVNRLESCLGERPIHGDFRGQEEFAVSLCSSFQSSWMVPTTTSHGDAMLIRVMAASPSLPRRLWYRNELERLGCDVETATDEPSCLAKASEFHPDVLILESSLPGGGIDEVLAVREREPSLKPIPVIVIDDRRDAAQTYRIGAYQLAGYWKSAPSADELMLAIRLTIGKVNASPAPASVANHGFE